MKWIFFVFNRSDIIDSVKVDGCNDGDGGMTVMEEWP